jgi:hypothetical protein
VRGDVRPAPQPILTVGAGEIGELRGARKASDDLCVCARARAPQGCAARRRRRACRWAPSFGACAAPAVSQSCGCNGSPCLRRCVHGAPIGGAGEAVAVSGRSTLVAAVRNNEQHSTPRPTDMELRPASAPPN